MQINLTKNEDSGGSFSKLLPSAFQCVWLGLHIPSGPSAMGCGVPGPEVGSRQNLGRPQIQALGDGYGQGGLACCDSWGRKESDRTERLN